MEDIHNKVPSSGNKESGKKTAKLKTSRSTVHNIDKKAVHTSDTNDASQRKSVSIDFGEFHLPPRPTPEVIDIDDSEEEASNKSDDSDIDDEDEDDDEDTASVSGPRLGSLPPAFYRLHSPSSTPNLTPKSIPMTQVKAEAATHTIEDQQILHIYIRAAINIKADMPDWPGLMKVFDFLHYQVGPNATILVLPSKRRGGDENPILTRWTKTTNRSVFPIYFQGYTVPKTPTSAAAAAKKAKATKQQKDDSGSASKGTTLHVRACVSIQKFQLAKLGKAMANITDPHMQLNIDPIRAEMVEKIGWITGSHKIMNISHWQHFLHTQLKHFVGSSYEYRLQMDALPPPRSASGNERYRQTHPKNGVDPIQMWGVYTGRPSAPGLSSALHSLFHTTWKGKLFGQDMQFLPIATGDTPDGQATMWLAAKTWQDNTVVIKSFGLHHLHDLIMPQGADGMTNQSHSLAYYCRQVHQPGGPPLFRAVEEQESPTPSDLLIHGPGPVAYFLVHKDDKRVAEMFAADVYNTLVYTNPTLKAEHVYRMGSAYVPLAATQAVADAEAAEALEALHLRVNGTPDIKPSTLHLDSVASSKTTASNPLSTPTTTPQRKPKKQRVYGFPQSDSHGNTEESTATFSTLTATENRRISDLENQVKSLQDGNVPYTAVDIGEMLKRVLQGMFPTQADYTAALFQEFGFTGVPNELVEPISPPQSPSQLTHSGPSHEMMDTDTTSHDEYHTAKQAEMDGEE